MKNADQCFPKPKLMFPSVLFCQQLKKHYIIKKLENIYILMDPYQINVLLLHILNSSIILVAS